MRRYYRMCGRAGCGHPALHRSDGTIKTCSEHRRNSRIRTNSGVVIYLNISFLEKKSAINTLIRIEIAIMITNAWGCWEKGMLPVKFKREFGKRFFGSDEFWVGVDYDVLSKFLQECDGMPVTMVEEKASKWVERRRTWQEREERAAAEWQ